jgi:hypothetical protein
MTFMVFLAGSTMPGFIISSAIKKSDEYSSRRSRDLLFGFGINNTLK